MTGIIPVTGAGGVAYNSASVENTHLPDAPFTISCPYLGLPSNCTARILPKQINAITSELLNLGACFDPDGTWDCNSVTNLCTLFTQYRTDPNPGTVNLFSDMQDLLCGVSEAVPDIDARFLFCDGDGNIHKAVAPFTGIAIANAVCADPSASAALAACLISTDEADQAIETSVTSGLLYARSHGINIREVFEPNDRNMPSANMFFGGGQVTIPNTSDQPIDVMITIDLDADLEDQNDGDSSVNLSFSRFSGPGGLGPIIMDAHQRYRNVRGGTGFTQINSHPAAHQVITIPPGGLTIEVGFEGSSVPNDSWRATNIKGVVNVYGVWSAVVD